MYRLRPVLTKHCLLVLPAAGLQTRPRGSGTKPEEADGDSRHAFSDFRSGSSSSGSGRLNTPYFVETHRGSSEQVRYSRFILCEPSASKVDSAGGPSITRGTSLAGNEAAFHARYEITKGKIKGVGELGEGAFGSVLRCVAKKSKAQRAVKIGGAEDKKSFLLWGSLGRHQNIVELIEHFEEDSSGMQMAVMGLCFGQDVCDWLISMVEGHSKTPKLSTVVSVIEQMCFGVRHCHERGVLHRDIKLDNFLFEGTVMSETDRFVLKLCDFGAAVYCGRGGEITATKLVGTPIYLAPESAGARRYSEKSDIYALGICLFALLTGNFPYNPPMQEEMDKLASSARDGPLDTSAVTRHLRMHPKYKLVRSTPELVKEGPDGAITIQIIDLLRGMLEPDPKRRWSMDKVCSAIQELKSSLAVRLDDRNDESAATMDESIALSFSKSLRAQSGSASFTRNFPTKSLKFGETLFVEGELIDSDDVFIVARGELGVFVKGAFITTLKEGAIVGEMAAVLNEKARTATVKAASKEGCELSRMSRAWFEKCVKQNTEVSTRAVAEMAMKRLNLAQTIAFLSKSFDGITSDPDFLKEVAEKFVSQHPHMYWDGEYIIRQGSGSHGEPRTNSKDASKTDRSLFLVQSGEIEVVLEKGAHGEKIVAHLGPGAILGEMAALLAYVYPEVYSSVKHSASVRARGHAECLEVRWSDVESVLERYPSAKAKLVELAKSRHKESFERAASFERIQ